jgi:hypothetical protein
MKKIDKIIEEFENTFILPSPLYLTGSDFKIYKKHIEFFIRQALTDYKEETLKLITEEIAQAQIEGTPTSRLTSLYNKIK